MAQERKKDGRKVIRRVDISVRRKIERIRVVVAFERDGKEIGNENRDGCRDIENGG